MSSSGLKGFLPAERAPHGRAVVVLEEEVVDLVRILVLDEPPGVPGAERRIEDDALVEDDEAFARARASAVRDPNRDLSRDAVEVEPARVEGSPDRRLRLGAPAFEDVVAPGGLRRAGEGERGEESDDRRAKDASHALVVPSAGHPDVPCFSG
jgi:hypothetical protein